MNTKTNFLLNCLKLKISLAAEEWDESEVKRDKLGRFSPKNESATISKDDPFKKYSDLLLTPDLDIRSPQPSKKIKDLEKQIKEAGEKDAIFDINIKEELDKLSNFYQKNLMTIKGSSKKMFEEAINSKLYKSIKDGSIKDEAKNVAEEYGEKLSRLFEESEKIINANKNEDELDLGGVLKDTIKKVSEGLKNANEEQLQVLAGGLVVGSAIALTGFLAASVLPVASQLAIGGIAGDLIFTSALMDDLRNTINMNKDPAEILKDMEELSKAGKLGNDSGEELSDIDKIEKVIALTEQMKKQHRERIQEIEKKRGEVTKEIKDQKLERLSKQVRDAVQTNRENLSEWTKKTDQNIENNIENSIEGFKKSIQAAWVLMKEDFQTVKSINQEANDKFEEVAYSDLDKKLKEDPIKAIHDALYNSNSKALRDNLKGIKEASDSYSKEQKSLNLNIGIRELKEKFDEISFSEISKKINESIIDANN